MQYSTTQQKIIGRIWCSNQNQAAAAVSHDQRTDMAPLCEGPAILSPQMLSPDVLPHTVFLYK